MCNHKENINTLESDSEMLITMMGAFAQAESESMSASIVWGKRQAMREGKTNVQYQKLYAYELDKDGKPRIIPEQADVVRGAYNRGPEESRARIVQRLGLLYPEAFDDELDRLIR